MSEDLYWRLHTLSKMLEQSDIIDGTVHRDAYPTILDAMKAIRSASSSAVFNNLFEQSKRIAAERDDALSELQAERLINEGLRKTPITDETYIELAEDIARLTAEGEALKRFALAMLEHWPLGEVDGGELQEEAVKHGLLVPETRTAVCSEEGCNCAEYYSAEEWAEGITCYRKAPWLFPAKPSTNEGPSC